MKPRILIIEDEPGIADTIRYALATEGFEPVWCATGAEALREIGAQPAAAEVGIGPVALVILDVGLPDVNGFELFRRIQATSGVPIMFLTARSDEIDRVVGLELGADDYMSKPFSPRELAARVRMILRRAGRHGEAPAPVIAANTSATPPGPAPSLSRPLELDEERRQIRFYGRLLDLSRYEYGIMRVLMARPGRVYTRDELLNQVWDTPEESFDRTVDAHIKTLRHKLKAIAPDVEAIRTHRGTGYALAEDLPPDVA